MTQNLPRTQESRVGQASTKVDEELTLLDFSVIVLQQRRLIIAVTSMLVVLVVGGTLLAPRSYTAIGSIVPNAPELGASRASGLAAQLGVALPSLGGGQTPDFYAELLQSPGVLASVVEQEYEFAAVSSRLSFAPTESVVRGTLMDIFEIEETSPIRRRDEAVERLREMISVTTVPLSGTVNLRVTTHWPALSHAIAGRMLQLVNEFNRIQRQTQARAEREFVEGRMAEARAELHAAEDSQRIFLERNRTFESSPSLRFEFDRLARGVAVRQQVFVSLAQAYEQSRIDEVRNTPVVTVVQEPALPGLPERRRLLVKLGIALVLGLGLGIVVAVVRENIRTSQAVSADRLSELARLRSEALRDLKRPWRLFYNRSG